ncbi:hypothetical protein ACFPMF_15250 [Larkinella bovis]|uniref:Uncharacterized protein n=1 Tax=Larkinella bovis TaxID=683041 RepID=A0ABW0ID97_9BACT
MQNENKRPDQAMNEPINPSLLWSLKVHGFLFPETDEEVEAFRINHLSNPDPLPDFLTDPMAIFNRPRQQPRIEPKWDASSEIGSILAMAAREGGDIPEDVLKQMEQDRQEALRRKKS